MSKHATSATADRYQQAEIPGKGIGMVATSTIPRGTLIISEAPLFTLPFSSSPSASIELFGIKHINSLVLSTVSKLSKDQQTAFLCLHNAQAKPKSQLPPFLGIVSTNAFGLGVDAVRMGVFEVCSRFNHSCNPNAEFLWNENAQNMEVRAIVDIAKDNEITLCYLGLQLFANHCVRQEKLMERYGFMCQCSTCGADDQTLALDDQRRGECWRLREAVGDGIMIAVNPSRALKYCREYLRLLEILQLCSIVSDCYYDAFQVCVAHGDLARASAFIKLQNKAKEEHCGSWAVDSGMRGLAARPQSHRLYQQVSRRWNTKIQHARELGSDGFEDWLWMRAEK